MRDSFRWARACGRDRGCIDRPRGQRPRRRWSLPPKATNYACATLSSRQFHQACVRKLTGAYWSCASFPRLSTPSWLIGEDNDGSMPILRSARKRINRPLGKRLASSRLCRSNPFPGNALTGRRFSRFDDKSFGPAVVHAMFFPVEQTSPRRAASEDGHGRNAEYEVPPDGAEAADYGAPARGSASNRCVFIANSAQALGNARFTGGYGACFGC